MIRVTEKVNELLATDQYGIRCHRCTDKENRFARQKMNNRFIQE